MDSLWKQFHISYKFLNCFAGAKTFPDFMHVLISVSSALKIPDESVIISLSKFSSSKYCFNSENHPRIPTSVTAAQLLDMIFLLEIFGCLFKNSCSHLSPGLSSKNLFGLPVSLKIFCTASATSWGCIENPV